MADGDVADPSQARGLGHADAAVEIGADAAHVAVVQAARLRVVVGGHAALPQFFIENPMPADVVTVRG